MKKYIGIDVGGMSIKGGVITHDGEILSKGSCPTDRDKPYAVMAKNIYNLCLDLLDDAKLKKEDIEAVGMGCPGTIWREKGLITFANNLDFYNVPLVEEFKKFWDINTQIENDANCAALGENRFGSGKGYKDCIFVTLGTGVGTGIIIDDKIYSGRRGAGAEAGHMVIRINGEKCTCGRRGCWEVYASASALIRDTKRAMKKNPDT
ncbi:MAG: ROK family protein, partial [Bacillota bacterium]